MKRKQPPQPTQPHQPKESGRATTDERGNSVWEWKTDTGSFKRDIDPQQLERLLNTGLSTDATGMPSGVDPYNHSRTTPTTPEAAAKKPPRKVDLRKLSEEIKQGKILPKHQK
jgi:hypothetical protein